MNDNLKMKAILVTGGCGFIGSHFVRLLCAEGDFRVVNLDKLTYAGNLENLADVPEKNYRFVCGDISDPELVGGILQEEKPWAIVNFAAESHVDRSILDSSPFLQTNINGVQVILEAVRKCPVERFVQVSTDEVYGDREGKEASTEESPLNPSSPYAASKAAADLLCLAYRRTYGLPVLITRSSNNYGPFQFPEKLMPLVIRNAFAGLELPVYGDGLQCRDWLYVEDNVRAVFQALEKGKIGSVYNVGAGQERTNLEAVQALCRLIAEESNLDADGVLRRIQFVADRPGHDRRYALNSDKALQELGWSPQHPFEVGLRRTVRWYTENPGWVNRIISGEYQTYYDQVYARRWGGS
jgi:dTDP-glucose 4,6-dehydratase